MDDLSRSTLYVGIGSGIVAGLLCLLLSGVLPIEGGLWTLIALAAFAGALSGGFLGGMVGLWSVYRDWSRRTALALSGLLPFGLAGLLLLLNLALG